MQKLKSQIMKPQSTPVMGARIGLDRYMLLLLEKTVVREKVYCSLTGT